MAISIVKRPHRFTPAGSPIIWQVSTDNTNTAYFRCEVLTDTGGTINTLDIYPSPDLIDGAFIDLSKLLANTVKHAINKQAHNFVLELTSPVQGYRMKITERVISGTTVTDGAVYDVPADINYVFDATFDRLLFTAYNDDNYVIKASNSLVKFLTHKPNESTVNRAGTEFLYFMQDGTPSDLKVVVKIYNPNGALNTNYSTSVSHLSDRKMFRINASPKAVKQKSGVTLTDGMWYTIAIEDNQGNQKSEVRKYKVKDKECHLEVLNIFWHNSVGGVDSYQFTNPVESMTVAKTNIKKNPYRISGGEYTDIIGGVYNSTEATINSTPTIKVTVNTRVLTDEEVKFLGEMVYSKQCYLELTNGNIIPITLDGNTYTYQRTKYLQNQLNVMKFTFAFAEWIVPAIAGKEVSYIVQDSYRNKLRSGTAQKQGCSSPEFYGETVVYVVPEGTYTSDISQADADLMAEEDVAENKQPYANDNGQCLSMPLIGNDLLQKAFTKQGCTAPNYGQTITYSVPANTYFAYTKAEANEMAQADIDANGQEEANTIGNCLTGVGNDQVQKIFQRNNCGAGVGGYYNYVIPANTFFAATKQEANQKAFSYLLQTGQQQANIHGTCPFTNNTEIELFVNYWTVQSSSGFVDVYYNVYSLTPVTGNISFIMRLNSSNGAMYLVPNADMWTGSTRSADVWAGQFPYNPFDPQVYSVEIQSVHPNPDPAGTTYTW